MLGWLVTTNRRDVDRSSRVPASPGGSEENDAETRVRNATRMFEAQADRPVGWSARAPSRRVPGGS